MYRIRLEEICNEGGLSRAGVIIVGGGGIEGAVLLMIIAVKEGAAVCICVGSVV